MNELYDKRNHVERYMMDQENDLPIELALLDISLDNSN